jgi:glycosyltransferase involved in cell wall biosynthesis
MIEDSNELNQERTAIRPIILADDWVIRFYGSFIRRLLVSLTGGAYTAALVGPEGQDTHNVLHPSVEHILHPEIRCWPLAYKNRPILLDKLVHFKPTLLHSFWPGDRKLAQFLSEALELPVVTTVFEAVSLKAARQFSDTMIFVASSEPIYQSLIAAGIQPDRIVRVPLGTFVDEATVCFDQPGQMPSMVICETLVNALDYEPLFLACRHLLADGFDFSVAVMGEGVAEQAIRKLIKRLGLTLAITVVPPLRPVRPVLAGMDIFLHLKDRKRCNLALLEAMSVGLVVAGCPDGTMGLLRDDQTAIVFDPSDEMSVYQGLKRLLSTPELARRLAENARLYLQEHHGVSGMIEGYLEVYKRAMNT